MFWVSDTIIQTPFSFPFQVEVTATDPSSVLLSVSDVDSVRLARSLELGLHKNASYMESLHGTDTIDYSFEVSTWATVGSRG